MRTGVRALRRLRALLLAGAVVGLVGLVAPRSADAAIGDPTITVGPGRFAFGAELDIVFDKDIDPGNNSLEMLRAIGTASYGFTRTWDGFVNLGFFNGEFTADGADDVDIDPGLVIGVGFQGAFNDQGDIRYGLLGQVNYYTSELDIGADIDWFEAELAPAISYRGLGQIVPYGGLLISYLDGDVDGFGEFENEEFFGIFGGATFSVSPNFVLGGELRLLEESAIAAFARFLF